MNWDLLKPVLAGLVRHALTALGGALVTDGIMQSSDLPGFIGAGMMLAGIAWSWWQKVGQAKVAALFKTAPAPAAKVVALFAILILGALLVPQARAADALPVPVVTTTTVAPVTAPCSPTSCTGFYIGANLTGVMTNANIVGNGINGSVAGGGQSIGGQLGYQFANGTWFFGPEFDFDYTVGGTAPDGGSAPTYLFGEYLKIGTSLATLFGVSTPTIGTPGIPAALANAVISPYLIFGAAQRNWGTGWATGAGVEFALSGHWFVDTRYTYINYGSANVTATETAKSENLVTIGFNYKF